MMTQINQFIRDEQGGPAAEFAMVLPILLIFLFGIIDVGRLMWDWNRAEKATQMGVRFAVAADIVPSGLDTYSFAVDGGVPQGEPVPIAKFPGLSCTGTTSSATCTCKSGGTCEFPLTGDPQAFNNIVDHISRFKPDVAAANVIVDYDYSGLGFAGDPNGPDVAPLVTVRLQNLTFQPLLIQIFGAAITLPDFRAALTLEDGDGTYSN